MGIPKPTQLRLVAQLLDQLKRAPTALPTLARLNWQQRPQYAAAALTQASREHFGGVQLITRLLDG